MRLNISPTPWAPLRPRTVAPCHMGAARTRALSSATAGSESWAGRGGAGGRADTCAAPGPQLTGECGPGG